VKENYERLHRLALNSHPRDFEEPKVDGSDAGLPDSSWYNLPKRKKIYQNGEKYTK
jgi:hypothetical protein